VLQLELSRLHSPPSLSFACSVDHLDHNSLPARRPSDLVALGGGSARGYAHVGALASLERNGLVPDIIAGTSFGAVVGAEASAGEDRKSTRLNSSHVKISYAAFSSKKKIRSSTLRIIHYV